MHLLIFHEETVLAEIQFLEHPFFPAHPVLRSLSFLHLILESVLWYAAASFHLSYGHVLLEPGMMSSPGLLLMICPKIFSARSWSREKRRFSTSRIKSRTTTWPRLRSTLPHGKRTISKCRFISLKHATGPFPQKTNKQILPSHAS